MKPNELAAWVETAREHDATKLVVYRARKNGGVQGVFSENELKGLDVPALLTRMREDTVLARRLNSAVFELRAVDKGKDVMVERITITKDDEDEQLGQDPSVEMMRIMATREQQTHGKMLECVDRMLQVNATLENVVKTYREKEGEMLSNVFDFSMMKREQEDAIALSADRRAMWAKGIEELAPILSTVITKLSKNAAPAFLGLFHSLKEEQLETIMAALTPEQRATFATVVDELQKSKKGEGASP